MPSSRVPLLRLFVPLSVAAGCTLLPAPTDVGQPLQARADRVSAEVAALRDLAPIGSVPASAIDKDTLQANLAEQIDESWTDDDSFSERAYKVLGLFPESLDVRTWAASFLRDQVGGYYDPDEKAFYTVGEDTAPATDPDDAAAEAMAELFVLSHELTHALEDHHFGLDRDEDLAHDDAALAFSALVEGSAMEVGAEHTLWRRGVPSSTAGPLMRLVVEALTGMDSAGLTAQAAAADADMAEGLGEAPPVVQEALIFPYLDGWRLVNALRGEYGWAAVDAAYDDPPESSEQVLFPERYLDRRDRPVLVALPDPPAGSRALWTGTLGMLTTSILLEPTGDGRDADGWDGDTLALWETPHGDVVAWVSVWDRAGQASAFADDVAEALGVHGSVTVAHRDDVVAVVKGLPAAEGGEVALGLLDGVTLTRAPDDRPPLAWWWRALNWPLGASSLERGWGAHVLGGAAIDWRSHDGGHRLELLDSLALHSENNVDHTAFWLALGLLGFSTDRTLDATWLRVPLVLDVHAREHAAFTGIALDAISWEREGGARQFDLLWGGLLRARWGDGVVDGQRLRLFFLPIPGV